MTLFKPVGRGAAARKYDLLTALGARALALGKAEQRLILRLITLITARYNWARDELAVGQREIARLWAVDERTVKREMAWLREKGWLVVKRQGVRGRVTEYALALDTIFEDTRAHWEAVGPDFEARLQGDQDAGTATVVPLPVKGVVVPPNPAAEGAWARAKIVLHQTDPACYAAWIQALAEVAREDGRLTLRAPSRFHASYIAQHLEARLLAACQAADRSIEEISVIS